VHDFGPVKPHIRQWAIIASAYSNRHCYKVGIDLKNALSLNKKPKQYPAQMVGRKDDDITIHIMTEEERKEADLEWKWNNPVSEEVIEKYNQMANHKSRGFFEPLND
jgi:ribosomal silencing factor RsfS